MVDKADLTALYTELDESIKKEDDAQCFNISSKILSINPKEKPAQRAKIISYINLNRSKDLISFITSSNLQNEYILEYAYALYDDRQYDASISFLEKSKSSAPSAIIDNIDILLAQNFVRIGDFKKSYEIYKERVKVKGSEIENDTDLLSNFFATYALAKVKDSTLLRSVQKYIGNWESFYNYAVLSVLSGDFNGCIEAIRKINEESANNEDDYNKLKNLHLELYLIQSIFDGFEINKYTNINEEFMKVLDTEMKNKEFFPYFYNNILYFKKDKDAVNETLKKIDTFLKNDKLNEIEKMILMKNKINFLIRANKFTEAMDLVNTSLTKNPIDPDLLIAKSFIYFKTEKEKINDKIQSEPQLNSNPYPHLLLLQLMLSSITSKSSEQFHLKLLSFAQKFRSICLNFDFISFFIGFYTSRKLSDYLKEFLKMFKDPIELSKNINSKSNLGKLLLKMAYSFYSIGQYEDSVKFYAFYLDNMSVNDKVDKEVKTMYIQALAHVDVKKSEEIRRGIDETAIDLSNEHMNSLLYEFFTKYKKPAMQNKEKKKRKRKKRLPKNFDPKKPGSEPDPERWLPKLQRKKYRNLAKNKMAYQGAAADNKTTTSKFN